MPYQLFSLREQPHYLATLVSWIHREWGDGTDISVDAITRWLGTHLARTGFPASFVLVSNNELVGSVSFHETEAEDRPAYRPYLSALIVAPEHRRSGFGTALVRAVETHASQLGHAAIYLNADDAIMPFYERLGWRVVERGYGRNQLNIMQRQLALQPKLLHFDADGAPSPLVATAKPSSAAGEGGFARLRETG